MGAKTQVPQFLRADTQSRGSMTFASACHIALTPTQPAGDGAAGAGIELMTSDEKTCPLPPLQNKHKHTFPFSSLPLYDNDIF